MSELESFVVGYIEETGGLAEPAGPEMHEVIIPDNLARQWRVSAYQNLAFGTTTTSPTSPDVEFTRLSYNHTLVEAMIEDARLHPAPTHFYINDLRLNKKGLDELARSAWGLPNARVVPRPRAVIGRVLSTYIRFNFKATLVSDEKQEQLVSILMDAHSGYAATPQEAARIYQATSPHRTDMVLKSLSPAPMRWKTAAGKTPGGPLTPSVLKTFLSRAQTAIGQTLDESLTRLEKRSRRFYELDEARLNEYYDEIERDLKQRLATALPDRRISLEEKLAVLTAERAAKLNDAAERYRGFLNLTLLNAMIISQPKLVLPVGIENRNKKIETYAVWDPLLHRLEPLACEICGQAGEQIYLCHNGHLAHKACLAPSCIDCRRVFCADCAGDVGQCDVCRRSLCRHSRITCPECGRGTCREHKGLCHANQGQPVDLGSIPEAKPEPEMEPPLPSPKPKPAKNKKASAKNKRAPKSRAVAPRRKKPSLPKGGPKPQRAEVVTEYDAVAAYMLASHERQIASRVWRLVPNQGIIITCQCEKGETCQANNKVMRPALKANLVRQLLDDIDKFRREYGLPVKKVKFNRAEGGHFTPTRRLLLIGLWNDEKALAAARNAFDRIYRRA